MSTPRRASARRSLRLRTHRDHQPERVLRTVRDGEPHVVTAEAKETLGEDVWWVAQVVVRNVETHYRWLLVGGAFDFAWLTAGGLVDYDVPDATDFVVSATAPPPTGRTRRWSTRSSPTGSPARWLDDEALARRPGSGTAGVGGAAGVDGRPGGSVARTPRASTSAVTSTARATTSTTSPGSGPTCST